MAEFSETALAAFEEVVERALQPVKAQAVENGKGIAENGKGIAENGKGIAKIVQGKTNNEVKMEIIEALQEDEPDDGLTHHEMNASPKSVERDPPEGEEPRTLSKLVKSFSPTGTDPGKIKAWLEKQETLKKARCYERVPGTGPGTDGRRCDVTGEPVQRWRKWRKPAPTPAAPAVQVISPEQQNQHVLAAKRAERSRQAQEEAAKKKKAEEEAAKKKAEEEAAKRKAEEEAAGGSGGGGDGDGDDDKDKDDDQDDDEDDDEMSDVSSSDDEEKGASGGGAAVALPTPEEADDGGPPFIDMGDFLKHIKERNSRVGFAGGTGTGKSRVVTLIVKTVEPTLGSLPNGSDAAGVTPETVCLCTFNETVWPKHYKDLIGDDDCMTEDAEVASDWYMAFSDERKGKKPSRSRLLIMDDAPDDWTSNKYEGLKRMRMSARAGRCTVIFCDQRLKGKGARGAEFRGSFCDINVYLGGWDQPGDLEQAMSNLKGKLGTLEPTKEYFEKTMLFIPGVTTPIQSVATVDMGRMGVFRLRLYPEPQVPPTSSLLAGMCGAGAKRVALAYDEAMEEARKKAEADMQLALRIETARKDMEYPKPRYQPGECEVHHASSCLGFYTEVDGARVDEHGLPLNEEICDIGHALIGEHVYGSGEEIDDEEYEKRSKEADEMFRDFCFEHGILITKDDTPEQAMAKGWQLEEGYRRGQGCTPCIRKFGEMVPASAADPVQSCYWQTPGGEMIPPHPPRLAFDLLNTDGGWELPTVADMGKQLRLNEKEYLKGKRKEMKRKQKQRMMGKKGKKRASGASSSSASSSGAGSSSQEKRSRTETWLGLEIAEDGDVIYKCQGDDCQVIPSRWRKWTDDELESGGPPLGRHKGKKYGGLHFVGGKFLCGICKGPRS